MHCIWCSNNWMSRNKLVGRRKITPKWNDKFKYHLWRCPCCQFFHPDDEQVRLWMEWLCSYYRGPQRHVCSRYFTATEVGTWPQLRPTCGWVWNSPSVWRQMGENLILTHCGHDSNSQASNSPDVCQDYEVKAETEQHIDAGLGPEEPVSSISLSQTQMKNPDREPGQEFAPYTSELSSENVIPLPPVSEQTNTNDSSQPSSQVFSWTFRN